MILEDQSESLSCKISTLQEENSLLKEQMNKVYNIIPILMAMSTINDGKFINVNQAWLDSLEYTLDEVIGKTSQALDIFFDFSERQKVAQLILQNGTVRNQEIRIKTKTGKIRIGLFSGDLLTQQDEKILLTTMVDITEQKIQQERLIKAEAEKEKNETLKKAMELKDEFLYLISHEFKTPLTVINAAIQAMEFICKDELSEKSKGFLNKIRQNSNRQLKLVNNLLDITRMNAGHLKINKKDMDIVLLTRSITESIRIYAEQKDIKLSFSSTLGKKVIGIDAEKYERILLNLLSNAIKFTPRGKSITVKVSQKIIGGKCKVCLQVRDKGAGISKDKQELIFEKFGQADNSLTRQAEGTGIGLYLVKMLVEMLDGEIMLESKVGAGSTFTILLPVNKVKDTPIEQMIKEISDNRLIQATAIEFSDINL